MASMRTGAQIIWEALVREGVTTVFGYPGGAILPAYDALLDYPIRHVLVRHEQGATHMADGYARASGQVGVAVATSGPGATNMVTGIATAMLDSSPIVCITGQVGSRVIGTDAFQETDVTGVTLPITWVYRWTRQKKKYSQSFAHTLLVIPIAIALVVFLVKGSVALAFGLAGIVAAVRFRASLNEPTDAVYMLMAIGIGLAAGTQLTTVAYLASLIFVVISLAVWKSNFGAKPAVLSGWRIVPPDALEQGSEAGGKSKGQ